MSFADRLVPVHVDYLLGGYELMASSVAWRRTDGTYTFRFVYRDRHVAAASSVVWTLRGVAG